LGLKATYIYAGFYYQNFTTHFPPKEDADGTWNFVLPMPEDGYLDCYDVRGFFSAKFHLDKNFF
jgi:hypothetical protein